MPYLTSLLGSPVSVRLKWGIVYTGVLKSIDSYMNVQLVEAFEHDPAVQAGMSNAGEAVKVGEVLIRCNNVLYVRGGVNTFES